MVNHPRMLEEPVPGCDCDLCESIRDERADDILDIGSGILIGAIVSCFLWYVLFLIINHLTK